MEQKFADSLGASKSCVISAAVLLFHARGRNSPTPSLRDEPQCHYDDIDNESQLLDYSNGFAEIPPVKGSPNIFRVRAV